LLNRIFGALTVAVPVALTLTGCGPSYSPNTYATNAAQQAAKVDSGVIAGVRPVQISAQGTTGGIAGAAAGGVAGSQVGVGTTSAFAAIGGSLIGGIAGVATEHIVGDTNGFEYIVRKANGDMISVAQKDDKPLRVGQKVLVIAGPQARIVPDYTVPFDPPKATAAAKSGASDKNPASAPPTPEVVPVVPNVAAVPSQLPAAIGNPSPSGGGDPPVIVPPSITPAATSETSAAKP